MLDPSQIMSIGEVERVGIGLAFLIFPILFIIGFAVHPNLLRPRRVRNVDDLVARVRHNARLQVGHVLVLLSTPMLIVVAIQCMTLSLSGPLAWLGLVGGAIAVCGVVILAADKGALGLVISAFDTLPDGEFAQLKPGLKVMQNQAGWLALLRGLLLLPLGFAVLFIAMLSAGVLPVWQAVTLLIGTILLVAPDGFEIVSLLGSVLLAIGLMPFGLQLLA
jgi:hypothetical protein